jgi:ATP-dependent protease ClpP protease subunit
MNRRIPAIYAKTLPIDIGGKTGGRSMRALSRSAGARFDVVAREGETVVELYDEIGFWGTTAKRFADTLKGISGDFTLRINSPGGDVFDGIAMHNEVVAHPGKVRVEVMGVAASAASIVAMAGDTIAMAPNAFIMIHNAWTVWAGDRNEFRDIADTLEGIDAALARTYSQRTGVGLKQVKEWMDDETWMDGPDAVEKGFADEVIEEAEEEAQARFDLTVFARTPEQLRGDADEFRCETLRDAERTLREAGFSRSTVGRLIAAIKNDRPVMREADGLDLAQLAQAIREHTPRI